MRDSTLRTARLLAAAIAAGPVVFAAVVAAVGGKTVSDALTFPAILVGLVALPVGWRVYGALQRGKGEGVDAGCRRFLVATVAAIAVTEAAALLGVVAFLLSRAWPALTGTAMHLILCGAIWPTEARLDSFLETGGDGP